MELKTLTAWCAAAAFACAAGAVHAGDYVLEIDGQKIELDLDHATSANLGERTAKIVLHQKAERTWRETGLSFVYPATIAPSTREIDKNVSQTILVSPSGTVVLVQHYIGTDPTALIDIMLNKMTEDEVGSGYTRTIKPTTRKLSDGVRLSGKIAHTEHPGDTWDREIIAVGDRHGGFLVVAGLNDASPDSDHAMLEKFWHSLHLSAPGAGADVNQPIE